MGDPTIEDYREGRAYSGDPNRWPPAPIDSLAALYEQLHLVLRGTARQPVGEFFSPIAEIRALKEEVAALRQSAERGPK